MKDKEDEFKIVVLGKVQSQLRPIISTIAHNKKAIAVDPEKCRLYKEKVKTTASNYYNGKPLDEPLEVEVNIYMEIPKSWTKKKKEMALSGELAPTSRSDLDNLTKGLWDGCTGVVWKDDGCIVNYKASKRYSEVPRAEIIVKKLSGLTSSNSI